VITSGARKERGMNQNALIRDLQDTAATFCDLYLGSAKRHRRCTETQYADAEILIGLARVAGMIQVLDMLRYRDEECAQTYKRLNANFPKSEWLVCMFILMRDPEMSEDELIYRTAAAHIRRGQPPEEAALLAIAEAEVCIKTLRDFKVRKR
jgi:hypothetical protein